MRIVLDTNVFISGIFFNGPPSQIFKACGNQSFQIVLSQQILDEYQRVAKDLSFHRSADAPGKFCVIIQ
jgi:predicted nucleic acid-binding protein